MKNKFKKSEFYNGVYKDSFVKFLELVDSELDAIDMPSIHSGESNPPICPLVMSSGHHRIKSPNRISEEIAAVLRNFEKWDKNKRSGILIWLYIDGSKLYNVVLTLENESNMPRMHVGNGEDRFNNGLFWFWTYPFMYDYCN